MQKYPFAAVTVCLQAADLLDIHKDVTNEQLLTAVRIIQKILYGNRVAKK